MSTAPVLDQLKALMELQKLDSQIYRLQADLRLKPAEIARLREEHSRLAQGLQAVEGKVKVLEVRRNERETDLGQKEEQIKKLSVQLFQVKTNKEYSAMQKEIEGVKADKSVLEEEILKLMEEVEGARAQMKREREALKEEETKLTAAVARIEEEAQSAKGSLQELQSARSAITPRVDPVILSQYERILSKKEGMALVPVRGDACGGCFMNLPPQLINEVHLGTRLVLCESCARILYVEQTA